MTEDELQNILNNGENISLEFKESRRKLPANLFETILTIGESSERFRNDLKINFNYLLQYPKCARCFFDANKIVTV